MSEIPKHDTPMTEVHLEVSATASPSSLLPKSVRECLLHREQLVTQVSELGESPIPSHLQLGLKIILHAVVDGLLVLQPG